MAENEGTLVDTLRERGVTCTKLKALEKQRIRMAQEGRKMGFENTSKKDEEIASSIRSVRNQVCKLR